MQINVRNQALLLLLLLAVITGPMACAVARQNTLYCKSARADDSDLALQRAAAADAAAAIYAPVATLDQAIALITEANYDQAAAMLRKLIPQAESAGDYQLAAQSIFWLGYCHEKSHQPQQATQLYRQLQQAYPESQPARMANLRLQQISPDLTPPLPPSQPAAE